MATKRNKKNIKQEPTQTYEPDIINSSLEKDLLKYEEMATNKGFKSLIDQIETEYQLSWAFMKPKLDEWNLRLKLYNNQKRDKEAIGDPLMFTIHQTVLASLYSDKLGAEFQPREDGDDDTAENLNILATYDEEDMEKDIFDYDFDWSASFYGRSLALFMDFDRITKTPIPEIINMMTWLRDPRAKSAQGDRRGRNALRFGGREIRLTKNDMKNAGVYFGYEKIKSEGTDINSILDSYEQAHIEAQGHGQPGGSMQLKGDNADFRVLEWLTTWNNKKVIVSLAGKRKQIVRYTELGTPKFPIIDRTIYPIAFDWDGVSIPDLSEDKQRGRSVIQNLGIKGVKAGLHTTFLYDTNKIKNKADLNRELNKHVGVDGPVSDSVVREIQRSGVKSEVQWIMNVLDTAAQRATATPTMQQGGMNDEKRLATEINLVASGVDTRYSLSARIFGWSEKRFWKQWYALYKKHFKEGIDEKSVRIAGVTGAKWRKMTRENIIMNADPDVSIESKIISEAQQVRKLGMFRAFIKDVMTFDPTANTRFALKRIGKLSGIPKDEIDKVLPPTIDELTAEEENIDLENNKKREVTPIDNDVVHIEIHNKAADTPFKYAHIQAHKKNMMVRKAKPEIFPADPTKTMIPTDGKTALNMPKEMINSKSGAMPVLNTGRAQ